MAPRRKSHRIVSNASFSKFYNTASDPMEIGNGKDSSSASKGKKRRNETRKTVHGVKSIMIVEGKANKRKRRKTVDGEKNKKVDDFGKDVKVSNQKKRKRKTVTRRKQWFGIRTRSSPHQLFLAMSFINKSQNERQQDLIKSMGFGKLLSFIVDGIPSKLGHYVVDMLDTDNMEINLGKTKIKVDKESIHGLLGIPNGGIDLGTLVRHTERDPIERRWRGRYVKKNSIGPSEIVNKMMENDYDEDIIFKIDFLMLFCSTMIECRKNGKCMFGVLDYISMDTDLKEYDWCGYVVDAIRGSKKKWKRRDLSSLYTGPLTILTLLYVDRISCPGMNDEGLLSPIAFWTKERLSKREHKELRNGGFGLGNLKELYVDDHNYDSHEEENIHENTECENVEDNSMVVFDDTYLMGHMTKLDSMYQRIVTDKLDFEAALRQAKNMFPESSEVSEFVWKYRKFYKVCVDFEDVEVGKAKPGFEPSSSCTLNGTETRRETPTGKHELPICDKHVSLLPETWTQAAINIADITEASFSVESTAHDGIKKYNLVGGIPSFGLGLTQDFSELQEQGKEKENVKPKESYGKQALKESELAEKREVEKDNKLCSGQGCAETVHQSTEIESGCSELADFQFEVSTKIHNPYVNKLCDHRNRGQNAVFFDGEDRLVKVVAFVSSLLDNMKKPILIIASSSALSLWEMEFSKWSKWINVVTYKGTKDIRAAIRCSEFQVLLSSPDAIVEDMETLEHIKWELLVIDECQCNVISTHLKKIQTLMADMKLLTVTGEPVDILQSYRNILSLVDCKNEKIHTDADMEMNDDISTLKERLSPFIAFECKFNQTKPNPKSTQKETTSVNILQIPASALVQSKNPCLTNGATTNSGLRFPAPHLRSSPPKFASFCNRPTRH